MPPNARKLTLADLELRGRRLLLRADLNAPLANGRVADDGRLRAALPAIRDARRMGAAVVVTSHLGRPGGAPDPALSLRPVAERLQQLLGDAVGFEATGRWGMRTAGLPNSGRARSSCSRTSASTREKPGTRPSSRRTSPPTATST